MSDDQCESLRELSFNFKYQAIVFVKCVIYLLGAAGIGYQWRKQGVRFLVHNNTKVVFKFYYFLNLYVATAIGLVYLFELVRLRIDCFVVNFRTILLSKLVSIKVNHVIDTPRGLGISAIIAAHHVILIISFERLYAAFFPAHFEKNSSKKLAMSLSITVMLLSFLYSMFCFSAGFSLFGTHFVAFFDERIPENMQYFEAFVTVMSVSNAFSLFMFCSDLYLNFIRKPTAVNTTLSISYQRSENRRIILIILPIEIAESLLGLATTLLLVLQNQFIDTSISMNRIFYLEIATSPSMLFSIVLALIIELRVARRVRRAVTEDGRDINHFDNLRRAWQT